ncbi:hypothetical protein LCGC14_1096680 [marine sediment metagenome]|uniref:DUF4870 domain-containing protein n=1 Tax=marine sediment metagenome TaxID=412755 RepID=A0A0F9QGT0_9ZZZZ
MATVEEQTQAPVEEQKNTQDSSTGLDPKLGALLSYLLGIIGGIIFLVIEKDNKYVRFHAAQSIVVWIAAVGVGIVFGIGGAILTAIPGIGFIGAILLFLLGLAYPLILVALAVILMIKAWTDYDSGQVFKIPVLGGIAEKIAGL